MTLIIHGVPLSQPFRSVIWPCLIKRLPFTMQLAVPGGGGKYATKRPEFRSKFPLGTIPSIESVCAEEMTGVLYLSEAPAILMYLSSKYGWNDVCPMDIRQRARVDEYCHWHHSNLRSLTRAYVRPHTVPHPLITEEVTALHRREAENALEILDRSYLALSRDDGVGVGRGFLLGTPHPTVADFLAYEEVAQVGPGFGNVHDLGAYPNIRSWLERMRTLPFHDEVHAAIAELGDLNVDDPPVSKRLGPATKVGLKSIAEAQKCLGSVEAGMPPPSKL